MRGRRFIRPTLYVEVDGEPRRLLAVLDHKPWAVEDGQDWVAAFAWRGDPVDLAGSELTVGPDITVELGTSGTKRPEARRRFARRPRADVLETELAATRKKAQRLARELHTVRADHAAELVKSTTRHEAELERLRSDRADAADEAGHRVAELRSELDAARDRAVRLDTALRKARDELALARADLAAQRQGLERDRTAMAEQASKAAAEEKARLNAELDAARREAANARTERDVARRESANARGERDAAIRDRDRARQERQVLLSRVRTEGEKRRGGQPTPTGSETTPTIPTQQIVQAPTLEMAGAPPSDLPARIAAVAALVVLVLILVLLVF